jgi:hypothetical protein
MHLAGSKPKSQYCSEYRFWNCAGYSSPVRLGWLENLNGIS